RIRRRRVPAGDRRRLGRRRSGCHRPGCHQPGCHRRDRRRYGPAARRPRVTQRLAPRAALRDRAVAMGWDADQQAAGPSADRDGSGSRAAGEAPGAGAGRTGRRGRRAATVARARRLARAILDSDEAAVEEAVLRLSRSRRLFAPLALAVGAVIMLFDGLKLLFGNWRLTLIQVLPAMWIWAAMYDLKAHVLYGKTYHVVTGPGPVP